MAKGSLFKEVAKDGTVSWRVRVDMVDPATGKRRQPQRTYKTKREAEAGMAQWLVEIERGTAVVNSRMTVGAYMAYWLDTSARHRVRPTTLESYEQKVRLYIVPVLGTVPIQRLTSAQVQVFYGGLLRGERVISPRTVRYVHAILHRALKEAVSLGIVSRNITDAVAPPKAPRPPIKSWDVADARRFLAVAASDHYHPLWLIRPAYQDVADHENWVSGTSGDAERAEKPVAQAHLVALVTRISKSLSANANLSYAGRYEQTSLPLRSDGRTMGRARPAAAAPVPHRT